jgi:hypothetical protein
VFLDERARSFYADWVATAADSADTGRDPDDRELTELVGELATAGKPFAFGGPRTMFAS